MDCPHCDTDVSGQVPNFGPVEKRFSCPECGARIGCKTYYHSQGFDPRDALPPGAMGMMQRRDGGIDIAVGNSHGNTNLYGGQTQLNAIGRVEGREGVERVLRENTK